MILLLHAGLHAEKYRVQRRISVLVSTISLPGMIIPAAVLWLLRLSKSCMHTAAASLVFLGAVSRMSVLLWYHCVGQQAALALVTCIWCASVSFCSRLQAAADCWR